uniref:Argininosuccinate lyase n=1 Tax=Cacopsylla melanoneura TaxID=428564 RepID=A0A8D8LSL1_9HEMI
MMNDIPEDNEDTEQNPLDNEKKSKPLWNSCFQQSTNEFLQQFNECISVDEVFYHEDIAGSIAHVTMLAECKIIETHEKDLIVKTLKDIEYDIEHGKVELKVELEDIHMNIESELIRRIGNVGRKLHTGRSRNDQVAVDLRLFTRKHIKAIVQLLLDIVKQLSKLAHQHKQDIMPGFTHFQFAQPISLGHYLLAYASMFRRDIERLLDCRKRVNENPLGSAALAGSSIMPQKKNPDILELIRGKTGRVYGNLFSILTVMKSQPLAYNKDSQECKQPLVDTVETLDMCLTALKLILNNVQFNTSQMYTTAGQGFSVATDIADYLVKKNIPFRSCHEIVGKIIKLCIHEGKKLHQLSLEELKNIDDHVEEDIYQVLSVDKSVEQKDHVGATSPRQVQVQVEVFEKFVTDVTDVLKTM